MANKKVKTREAKAEPTVLSVKMPPNTDYATAVAAAIAAGWRATIIFVDPADTGQPVRVWAGDGWRPEIVVLRAGRWHLPHWLYPVVAKDRDEMDEDGVYRDEALAAEQAREEAGWTLDTEDDMWVMANPAIELRFEIEGEDDTDNEE